MRIQTQLAQAALVLGAFIHVACGGGGSSGGLAPTPISIQLSAGSVTAGQDGTSGSVTVTVTRPSGNNNPVTLTASPVPAGVNVQISPPGGGNTGSVSFTPQALGGPPAGTYAVTINASDGGSTASASLSLVIAIVATVDSSVNTNLPFGGALNAFMSTSFQPAEWDYQFFANHPSGATTLGNLRSQHIRLQPVSQGTPQKADRTWDFTDLDDVMNVVIGLGDKSPELQLATAPAWMTDSSGHLETSHFQDFADYSADLVEYFNTSAGFIDSSGQPHVHSATSVTPVTWWGIFNEPNINGLSADQYVSLYNALVPGMQAAPSTVPVKFVAVELADSAGQPQSYMPTFVSSIAAPVDAVATHFYSSCNQSDSDEQVFRTIPGFVADVSYIYSQLKTNPALAHVPVWVTENNVNADFADASGNSMCNPGQKFVTDQRGSSAFFAAWRPYVFSQLVQAGVQALYHWDFDADQQFGEVDYNTGKVYLSYWVDFYLQRYYPACAPGMLCTNAPQGILDLTSTETATVETLATRNPDGSLVVMIANHAVNAPTDNNGPGAPRTVIVDLSALGSFSTGSQLTIDATTDPTQGPSAQPVTPASRMTVILNGYGVAFLTLKP